VLGLLVLVTVAGLATALVLSPAGRPTDLPPAPAASPTAAAGAATGAALRACERVVATGRDTVDAARPSFSHWAGHVRAQLDYDAGAATLEQTRERWATTKATADADLADFARADAAFGAVRNGCAPEPGRVLLAGGPTPADRDPVMVACRGEFESVSAAVAAAEAVVADWAAHVAMMKGKEHYGAHEYGRMWRDMVEAAPARLDRFARTSLAMSDHADCPHPA
jgi:hypothetical protein